MILNIAFVSLTSLSIVFGFEAGIFPYLYFISVGRIPALPQRIYLGTSVSGPVIKNPRFNAGDAGFKP